ncbi:MAG: hypothetical protein WC889_04045 [Myxococcota bacterium]|jgi:hypothetical protein
MRRFLLFAFSVVLMLPAPASALELSGNYGYAGEWGISASLSELGAGRGQARYYSGPVRLRHLAACGPNEVPQKSGEIHLSRVGRDRYAASLVVDGQQCTVSGALSPNEVAFARCGADARVPLRLWEK